jgi:predicted lipoprotein with Yx(FWY)xxD motif
MNRNTKLAGSTMLAATGAVLALTAACTSSGGGGGAYGGGAPSPAANGSAASVKISLSHGHLVGAAGRTLYTNTADTPTHLICTGSCLNLWPPVLGKASVGAGLTAADFGTVKRGTSIQVTYQGHPLYEFSSDSNPGDEMGNGLTDQGGTWHAAGAAVPAPSNSGGGGGGYGGGYP